ncbi:hypothetical protein R6Q59_006987 [Mikania micrantha]
MLPTPQAIALASRSAASTIHRLPFKPPTNSQVGVFLHVAYKPIGFPHSLVDVSLQVGFILGWLHFCSVKGMQRNLKEFGGVEIPKFVDKTTTEYKPKFDALLVEPKEAGQKSLKESERLEKEIAEVQELKTEFGLLTSEDGGHRLADRTLNESVMVGEAGSDR